MSNQRNIKVAICGVEPSTTHYFIRPCQIKILTTLEALIRVPLVISKSNAITVPGGFEIVLYDFLTAMGLS